MRQLVRLKLKRDGKESLSYITGSLNPFTKRAHITELHVAEQERGQGYGKMLVELFEMAAIMHIKTPIIVDLYSVTNAVAFYQKLGFMESATMGVNHMSKTIGAVDVVNH